MHAAMTKIHGIIQVIGLCHLTKAEIYEIFTVMGVCCLVGGVQQHPKYMETPKLEIMLLSNDKITWTLPSKRLMQLQHDRKMELSV